MPAGFQAWDAAGNLVVDLTDRLTQYVGAVTITGGSSGSVTVSGKGAGNKLWCTFIPSTNGNSFIANMPRFVVGSSSISWSFSSGNSSYVSGTLLYGFY